MEMVVSPAEKKAAREEAKAWSAMLQGMIDLEATKAERAHIRRFFAHRLTNIDDVAAEDRAELGERPEPTHSGVHKEDKMYFADPEENRGMPLPRLIVNDQDDTARAGPGGDDEDENNNAGMDDIFPPTRGGYREIIEAYKNQHHDEGEEEEAAEEDDGDEKEGDEDEDW